MAVAQALTASNTTDVTGAGQFTLSSTGTLAYVHGAVVPYPDAQLVAVDRQGRVAPLDAPTRNYRPSLSSVSPDGRHLAVSTESLTEQAVWVYDLGRGTLGKLTPGGESWGPRWAPDGRHIAFFWMSQGVSSLAWQRTNGTAGPEVLGGGASWPSSWSPDGRQLALVKDDDKIWIASLENDKATVRPLTGAPEDVERWAEFSPDGRWLAYGSNASGRFEVYVQPYPGRGSRQLVSLNGGESPAWSASGRELFFVSQADSEGRRRMMVVDVRGGPTLALGKPRHLFEFSPSVLKFACYPTRCYAVTAGGERFYVVRQAPTPPTPPVTHIQLIQNWTEELKARVPSGGAR